MGDFKDSHIFFAYMLNILSLLKQRPHTVRQLWYSRCFRHHIPLKKALKHLRQLGYIERKSEFICFTGSPNYVYHITEKGVKFLSHFPDWKFEDWITKKVAVEKNVQL